MAKKKEVIEETSSDASLRGTEFDAKLDSVKIGRIRYRNGKIGSRLSSSDSVEFPIFRAKFYRDGMYRKEVLTLPASFNLTPGKRYRIMVHIKELPDSE